MEIRITHQGAVLADLEITPDGQIQVRALQPGSPQGTGPAMGAPQYVWGGSGGGGVGAAQYVWGSQPGSQPGAPQYVWGGSGGGGVGAAQYVWGSQPGAPQYVWGGSGGGGVGAAQYVWGATNTRPGGKAEGAISVDCPTAQPAEKRVITSGTKVTDGLLDKASDK